MCLSGGGSEPTPGSGEAESTNGVSSSAIMKGSVLQSQGKNFKLPMKTIHNAQGDLRQIKSIKV